jgi:hypothetical protein
MNYISKVKDWLDWRGISASDLLYLSLALIPLGTVVVVFGYAFILSL